MIYTGWEFALQAHSILSISFLENGGSGEPPCIFAVYANAGFGLVDDVAAIK